MEEFDKEFSFTLTDAQGIETEIEVIGTFEYEGSEPMTNDYPGSSSSASLLSAIGSDRKDWKDEIPEDQLLKIENEACDYYEEKIAEERNDGDYDALADREEREAERAFDRFAEQWD